MTQSLVNRKKPHIRMSPTVVGVRGSEAPGFYLLEESIMLEVDEAATANGRIAVIAGEWELGGQSSFSEPPFAEF